MLALFFIVESSETPQYADECNVRDIVITGNGDDCPYHMRPTTTNCSRDPLNLTAC